MKIMTKRSVKETVVARKAISAPHADTALCKFVTKQIAALSGVKSQRVIAAEVGYDRPNLISMIKTELRRCHSTRSLRLQKH